ncbi:fatty-acyl-CoA synthase [Antricoccus suffuscus]|uniref:Fatty-acyl-CoA synthase n=1 Tax=Antricoccus suffuscus TaxID=1629062 RepID=A0A2T1A0D5_9ACTN|nr:AMP-binding protein [Antricoccus suffuscus]PRZ42062.1 fatty-acyl-CoA synthase [Antricoccus suffuscus]
MTTLDAAASSITVNSVFQNAFRIYSGRVAVTSEDGSQTYSEIGERSARLAAALTELGVRKGDRVAVLSETRPEYVETYAALASLGVTALTLNIRLHAQEIEYCIATGKPVAIIVSEPLLHLVDALRSRECSISDWICLEPGIDGYVSYEELLAGAGGPPPVVEISGDDIHNVLYTSGTTGRPKGAMISQSAAAVRALRLAQWFALTPEDGFIGWLPLFHCGGDESLYATMLTGGRFAALRKADPETMFRVIERDRLSWSLLLPGVLTDFLYHPRRTDYDLTSLRFAIGYANMMPLVVQELTRECDIDFYDAFGQTEASYVLAHGMSGPGEMPSLHKTPTPLMEVRITDAEMNEAPVGVPGECVVRGPSVMSGYLDDPEATEEVFRGGWLHTGDILVRHEDGTVSYVDREKFLVKTGGENVYPAEVEKVIAQMDAVQEVCVFGVPDERWGETVKAVVVLRPGASATAAEVAEHCRAQLAGYKRPRYVQFMSEDQLPRSATGKLQRHVLATNPVTDGESV